MRRLFFISKRSDFERTLKKIENQKLEYSERSVVSKKGMHSYVSRPGFNRNSSKKVGLNEKLRFFSI